MKKAKIGNILPTSDNDNHLISDYFVVKSIIKCRKVGENTQDGKINLPALMQLQKARTKLAFTKTLLTQYYNNVESKNREKEKNWVEYKKRNIALQNEFLKFNNFVKENSEKRARAAKKTEKEKLLQTGIEEQIDGLRQEIDYLESDKQELEEKLGYYNIYREFLQRVVATKPEIKEIRSILNRYEVLSRTRGELGEQQSKALTLVHSAREKLTAASAMHSYNTMKLYSEKAALQVRQEEARAQIKKWDFASSQVRSFAADSVIGITQVKLACWHLYKAMCHSSKQPIRLMESQTGEQLAYITRRIRQLTEVAEIVQKKCDKKALSLSNRPILTD